MRSIACIVLGVVTVLSCVQSRYATQFDASMKHPVNDVYVILLDPDQNYRLITRGVNVRIVSATVAHVLFVRMRN